ncbi:unnamed protein product [Ascophyllum nodosum]
MFSPSSSRRPPVRAKRDGERVSRGEYDGYGAVHASGIARVSHPKGFEPLKLEPGLAPGLGALVVCELGARQRVIREVLCRHIAPEAVDSKPVARGARVKKGRCNRREHFRRGETRYRFQQTDVSGRS